MSIFANTENGLKRWDAHARIPRHRHTAAYAAIVLSGGYEESGSCGRFRVGPGDVLVHGAFDAHLDRFEKRETVILDLMLPHRIAFSLGRLADVDAVVRAAERDLETAGALACEQIVEMKVVPRDWPDALAVALLDDPGARLDAWADAHQFSAETLSRGFRRAFDVTPAFFRAECRARLAFAQIVETPAPLSSVAATSGFADQAHMTRAVKALTGATPQFWRRSNPFKTGASLAA